MNQVIKELYDIEAKAGGLMEDAGLSRQRLQEEKRRQMEEITTGIRAEQEGRMAILKEQLEEQAREDIRQLAEDNRRQIEQLNETYKANLSAYAQKIVEKITEV